MLSEFKQTDYSIHDFEYLVTAVQRTMFRVQENLDGTTSIYCKNNGNLLCKISTKGTSSVPRPVNVVEPQPSNTKWLNNRPEYATNENPGQRFEDEESPIPSDNEDPKDELEDGGTQEGFLRFFDLIPNERLQATPREKLWTEFPLRKISRSNECRSHLREDKIPEQLPLTSHWVRRLLPMLGKGAFVQEEKLQVLLRSYDSFCRHPYNTACPTSCHFPKLRCREKKQYAISTPLKVLKNLDTAHTYSMGRRQREERKRTLRTGLDAPSRRLLRKFNGTKCNVLLKRLPQAEIDDWLSRRSPPSDSDDSDIEILEADPTYRPSRKVAALPPSRSRRGKVKEAPKAEKVAPSTRRCSVYLRDIVLDIRRRSNGYHYYRDTRIKVHNYRDFLDSLISNRPLLNRVYTARCTEPSGAFERNGIPTKPSASFQDMFMASVAKWPHVSSRPNQAVKMGNKRTAFVALGGHSSAKVGHKVAKPAQQQVAKFGQKAQPTATRTKGMMQMKPVASSVQTLKKSTVVLDLDTNSSAIRQLMKSPASTKSSVVVLRQQQSDDEDIPLIDLTEDSPPREPGSQISRRIANSNLVGSTHGPGSSRSGISVCPLSLLKSPSGNPARRQSSAVPLVHQIVGQPTKGQFPLTVGTDVRRPPSQETSGGHLVVYPQTDQRSFVVSQWRFRCFACGFQRFFYGPQDQPKEVETAVRDHLRLFHYVGEPEAFISRYLDSVNRCTVIEAFPGFKESEDD
ncbi:hypothetical protein JTE90_003759 [Oedothorax gibbosus]|uniref:Uncharacterized protein n=1 Tax=Oedothorax gibbosus TaxID=931172 RepID=A0AAV6VC43_9ARAC|nr:hypothetical protein JTE90_003759 [Oedothorax gibbosus]